MNRQFNYIVNAFLLFLFLSIGGLLIEKVFWVTSVKETAQVNSESPDEISFSKSAQQGRILFQSKCASCHSLFKNLTGPGLMGFEERGPWSDRTSFSKWLKNPAAFMRDDPYTAQLKKVYGSMMQAFPDFSNEEVNSIYDYLLEAGSTHRTNMPIAGAANK